MLKIILSKNLYLKIAEDYEQVLFGLPFEVDEKLEDQYKVLKDGVDITAKFNREVNHQLMEEIDKILESISQNILEGSREDGKEPIGLINSI